MKQLAMMLDRLKRMDYAWLLKHVWVKFAAGASAVILIVGIIFTLPVKSVTVEDTEPYYAEEISYEPYTALEYYQSDQSIPKNSVIAEGYFTVVPSGIVVPFQVERAGSRLSGKFENSIPGSFVIYNSANRIIWEQQGSKGIIDMPLSPGSYRAKFQENIMWGESLFLSLNISWNDTQSMTLSREVTQYRQVPRVVARERKVIREDRLSIWQIIFGEG